MPEQGLDMTQAQTLLEQMGGQGMAQRMNGDLFFIPHAATKAFTAC